MYNIVNAKMAKYIRVRCPYCWKVVRSNGNGEIIYSRDKHAADEVKSYMELCTVKFDSGKVMDLVKFTCPYCKTSYLTTNIDINRAKYK